MLDMRSIHLQFLYRKNTNHSSVALGSREENTTAITTDEPLAFALI